MNTAEERKADKKKAALLEKATTVNSSIAEWKRLVNATNVYAIDDAGYLCEVKHKMNEDTGKTIRILIPLANFTIRPIREVIEDNGLETTFTYEVVGMLHDGRNLPIVQVSAENFTSMSWVGGNWGMKAILEPGISKKDKIRHAAQLIAGDITRDRIYTYIGWRKSDIGEWIYLHAAGAVGEDGVSVRMEDKMQSYTLPSHCDQLKEAIETSLGMLFVAPKEVTWPLLAAVFLAPLCEPLRREGIEPAFILWMLGFTGSMKSTLTALFLSHFGKFDGKSLPTSFKATTNALEKMAFTAKDSILAIDDFHPNGNIQDARVMEQKVQQLLRGYGDRAGRTRMRSDMSIRPTYAPRGLAIITGEDLPKGPESDHARYLTVPVEKGSVDVNLLTKTQGKTDLLGQTMVGYLKWISPQMDDVGEKLCSTFAATRQRLRGKWQHDRTTDTVSWLILGVEMFLKFAIYNGVLGRSESEGLLREAMNCFMDLADNHSARMVTETPINQFLNAIREMTASNKAHFASLSVDKDGPYEGDKLGYRDENYYYLLPDVVLNAVTQFYQKQNRNFPITKDMLLQQLEKGGLIRTMVGDKGKVERTPGKKIAGKATRFIWLNANILQAS